MRTAKPIRALALLLAGGLVLVATASSAATATGRASVRIVQPTKVAVTPAAGWTASVDTQTDGLIMETGLGFSIDRPRDYSVGVRLERNDAPFGASETIRTGKSGLDSAMRLRVELPGGGVDPDGSHVRIVLHNH